MAFSLNKIQLIGKLGQDAETRVTNSGFSVTSFSLATDYSYKNKEGDWVRETTWHRVSAFNVSDFMKDNLKKGANFYVEGRMKSREYTDKENIKRTVWEVISDQMIPLSYKGKGQSEEPSADYSAGSSSSKSAEPTDDDLPF